MIRPLHALILRALDEGAFSSGRALADAAGMPKTTVNDWRKRDLQPESEYVEHEEDRERLRRLQDAIDNPPGASDSPETGDLTQPGRWQDAWESRRSGDNWDFSGHFKYAYDPERHDDPGAPPIRTPEQVRRHHQIGDEWVADTIETKDWTTSMKLDRLEVRQGEMQKVERPYVVQNFRIKVRFRRSRRREDLIHLAEALKEEVTGLPVPEIVSYGYSTEGAAYCAALDIADPHIGKYAWAAMTGRRYDLRTAESIYKYAVDAMLDKLAASGRSLSHIYTYCGHDGSHVDGGQHTTSGTLQDQDGKWQHISRVANRCYRYAIEKAVEVAPVRVVVIPGNHDERDAWYQGEILRARYEDHPHIRVLHDNRPVLEKTDRFGRTGFLWMHGKDIRLKDLPMFFANAYRELWGQTAWHEIVTGHLHKRTKHTVGDFVEADGAVCRISPSLCAPDAWHYRKGYVSVVRGSQCLTYHREAGYDGDIPFNVFDDRTTEDLEALV